MDEKRKYIRFPFTCLIHYSLLDREEYEETYVQNLSLESVAFYTLEKLSSKQLLRLKIRIPDESKVVAVEAIVAQSRKRPNKPGYITSAQLIDGELDQWEQMVRWRQTEERNNRRR